MTHENSAPRFPDGAGIDPTTAVPDLRTRRRLETQGLIHQAAVELFERQGVKTTTVEEIAVRAGVSSRTFFRHFASKEQAALPGQRRLRAALETLNLQSLGPGAALRSIEEMAARVIAAERAEDSRSNGRLRRLLVKEPDLLAAAIGQDQALVQNLRKRLLLQGGPGMDATTARLIAEVAMLVWRSSWEEWAGMAETGPAPAPAEFYADYRDALHRLLA